MYYGAPRTPSARELRLIEDAGHIAVIAIEGVRPPDAASAASITSISPSASVVTRRAMRADGWDALEIRAAGRRSRPEGERSYARPRTGRLGGQGRRVRAARSLCEQIGSAMGQDAPCTCLQCSYAVLTAGPGRLRRPPAAAERLVEVHDRDELVALGLREGILRRV